MKKRTRASNLKQYQEDYPYLDNCNIDHRLLGTTLFTSGCEHNSSARMAMMHSQITQALNIFGGERQRVFTGFDDQLKNYGFNDTKQTEDITIIAVIPKIRNIGSAGSIKSNPKSTVIYVNKDNTAGYFNVNSYEELGDGFGYETRRINSHLLAPNTLVKANTPFTEPPGGGELGCNAMVAMMRSIYTSEDAFAISESFAKRNQTYGMSKAFVEINKNQIPANIMGDEEEYKFMPDIGEQVGDDGILCAIKTPKVDVILNELSDNSTRPDYLHDALYKVPPGATIVNIEVYCDPKFNKNKSKYFDQLRKYRDQSKRYWTELIEVYKKLKSDRVKLSPTLHALFARALSFAPIHTKKQGNLMVEGGVQVKFIYIEVTYSWIQSVQRGFKFTGTEGGKGTICEILPDEFMPTNEYGETADVIIDPITVLNRMNLGQDYVMFLNRTSDTIMRFMNIGIDADDLNKTSRTIVSDINNGHIADPYEYILKYLTMVNENYANLIRGLYDNDRDTFVGMCVADGIHINYPPYLNTLTKERIIEIADTFCVRNTPVSFCIRKRDGTIKRVTTENPVPMGRKYMMVLCKVPHVNSAGVGRVSQFLVPIKPNSTDKVLKKRTAVRSTAIRFGEDEIRNLHMSAGVEATARLLCVYGCTPDATYMLMQEILNAAKPSHINRIPMKTSECIKKNRYISIQKSMMAIAGIEVE